ncbi:hypothetical protein [Nostoc sp. 'Peltigera membranacea cyanobiont' 232]|uniref:hypothetical protein n=1 Tax=Nostoc sp. 'Peltigera membranacea cyanobiont' 232 TaxID=2014531 RepID=UPI000B95C918|nr:hypothetical protein [Nostoc sp. 'Peltigera membranacea cyanobiont' 232]OYE00810.1 hypothetical protein CDG79_33115 [Nostoc sp. 'Peltigera membranacea cyanobiont' 232]
MPAKGFLTQSQKDNLQKALKESDRSQLTQKILMLLLQHFDQTGARVAGVNHTTNVICNPLYTIYQTTRNKDRLSVLKVFQNTTGLEFMQNLLTDELLENFHLPTKWINQLKLLPQQKLSPFVACHQKILDDFLAYRTR